MTAEETLNKVFDESPYNADFNISRPYIIKAMEVYAEQKIAEQKDTKTTYIEYYYSEDMINWRNVPNTESHYSLIIKKDIVGNISSNTIRVEPIMGGESPPPFRYEYIRDIVISDSFKMAERNGRITQKKQFVFNLKPAIVFPEK